MKQFLCEKDYISIFETYGNTDRRYLKNHYKRFCHTQETFYQNWNPTKKGCLLDVGAHWLHQSVLYAQDGFKVTATDFPETFNMSPVKKIAEEFDIELLPFNDLSMEKEIPFRDLPDNSFDIILFTEILEHITFNPVAMWSEFYRLLREKGKILLTTPNYYAARNIILTIKRFFQRMGSGITPEEILNTPTIGHHWKEYSIREIRDYFERLSKDFYLANVQYVKSKSLYIDGYSSSYFQELLEKHIRILRPGIYIEIDLPQKSGEGIMPTPSW